MFCKPTFYKSTFYKSMFYKSTFYKSMFYKSTFYKSMFYKSTPCFTNPVHSTPVHSSLYFTICLLRLVLIGLQRVPHYKHNNYTAVRWNMMCKESPKAPSTLYQKRSFHFENAANVFRPHCACAGGIEGNSAREVTRFSWRHRFRKAPFLNFFPFSQKPKAGVNFLNIYSYRLHSHAIKCLSLSSISGAPDGSIFKLSQCSVAFNPLQFS